MALHQSYSTQLLTILLLIESPTTLRKNANFYYSKNYLFVMFNLLISFFYSFCSTNAPTHQHALLPEADATKVQFLAFLRLIHSSEKFPEAGNAIIIERDGRRRSVLLWCNGRRGGEGEGWAVRYWVRSAQCNMAIEKWGKKVIMRSSNRDNWFICKIWSGIYSKIRRICLGKQT